VVRWKPSDRQHPLNQAAQISVSKLLTTAADTTVRFNVIVCPAIELFALDTEPAPD
jgi:hypothetical protein